jgi:hypothetical protein
MKVVCIDDHTLSSGRKIKGLTTGKIYDAEDKNLEFTYRIVDDNGEKHWYNDEVLMPLEKYRELQLKELGI